MRKFKRAVTDSESVVKRGEGRDGINNLINIYSAVTGKTDEQIENEFSGKGYGEFKTAVGEAVVEELRPVRENFNRFIADKGELENIYRAGAVKARDIAVKTLGKAMKKVGCIR